MLQNIWNINTSFEIADNAPRFAVVPIGSFEQHGKHLPVTTDTLIAGVLAKQLCDDYNGLLVSPIAVTCSHEHAGFPGTLSISSGTLIHVLNDLITSIEAQKIPLTVLLNCHGGNYVIGNIAQELNTVRPRVLVAPGRHHWNAAVSHAGIETSVSEDMHGGEIETSILLHAMPEVVRQDLIEDCPVSERPLLTLFGMKHYTKSGIIGFPSRATAEKGKRLIEKLTLLVGDDIKAILKNCQS